MIEIEVEVTRIPYSDSEDWYVLVFEGESSDGVYEGEFGRVGGYRNDLVSALSLAREKILAS